MPGRATLFDVCPAPVLCGERPHTSSILSIRLTPQAFEDDPRLVAHAIRGAVSASQSIDGVIVDAVGTAVGRGGSAQALVGAAAIALALRATVPVDVVVPAEATPVEIAEFCADERTAGIGVIVPLDAPISLLTDDVARWDSLRRSITAPTAVADRGLLRQAPIVRLQIGMVPDRALLDCIFRLMRDDGVTTIALRTDSGVRATHIERVAHAVDAMWTMGLVPDEIPCDDGGSLPSPQETDAAIVATLRKAFPIDVGMADGVTLARVPGVGRAAFRVIEARAAGALNHARDFVACGVDLARARPFLRHHSL